MGLNSRSCFALLFVVLVPIINSADAANGKVFREYIGAESEALRLADVPINPKVEVHFILSFLIDYTTTNSPSPNNGNFNIFWKGSHFTPSDIAAIKKQHPNVRFAVSLGGDTVGRNKAFFAPGSPDVWLRNAVASLTRIIKEHHIDGLDIDYEHFRTNPAVFADCMGQLVMTLKKQRTISFASIAPFDAVQTHYLALWNKYGHNIDYVNFQFYAYNRLGVSEFKRLFDEQASKYRGGSILASIISKGPGGLGPEHGFFDACQDLKKEGKLGGIFIWCADESQENRFSYEIRSQTLLAA